MRFKLTFATICWGALACTQGGCFFSLDRDANVPPGAIVGRAVAADTMTTIPFATVRLLGSGLSFRSNSDGAFQTTSVGSGVWTLKVFEDGDGDGTPERGAIVQTTLSEQLHPGESAPRLASVNLGDVALRGVGAIGGDVKLDGEVVEGARVVVSRVAGPAVDETLVGVEGQTTVFDGVFSLDGLIPGRLALVATATIDGAEFVSPSTIVTLTAAGLDGISLALQPANGTREVRLRTNPTPQANDDIAVELRGISSTTTFAGTTFAAPIGGAYNVLIENLRDETTGTLPGQVVPPGEGDLAWGPVGLVQQRCAVLGAYFDCDHDLVAGLPALVRDNTGTLVGDDLALWQQCGQQCAGLANATCEANGTTFDCDDDGDGQSDVTEPPECYGIDLGTDLDGDGTCDSIDPHPGCDDRVTPIDCSVLGTIPPLWFEYTLDEEGPDAGPNDAGPDDAGPNDAGPVDGGTDGGPSDAGPRDGGDVIPDGGPPPDAGAPDAGPPDAGPPDAGPPPVPAPPSTGLRSLQRPTPVPGPGPRLLDHQLLPAARTCAGPLCVTGGLVP